MDLGREHVKLAKDATQLTAITVMETGVNPSAGTMKLSPSKPFFN